MDRTSELPEPKKGQKEWAVFTDLYGLEWDHFKHLMFDDEDKITEFNYENFIPAPLLKTMDTDSKDFKMMIREINMTNKTQYEQHMENQEKFKNLMPAMSVLTDNEIDIFIHMLKNKKATVNASA
jgi:hypothetical protein